MGVKFGTLHRRIVLQSSSIFASVKSLNVKEKVEKSAQIIVPGNVKCSRIVSSTNRVANIEIFSALQKKNKIKILLHQTLCNSKNDLQHWVDKPLERIAPADCVLSASLCTMELSVSFG